MKLKRHLLIVAFCSVLTSCAGVVRLNSVVRSQLAPTGVIRIAINYGNPVLVHRDLASTTLSGVAIDLSRELERATSLHVLFVEYKSASDLLTGLKDGAWDVAFLAIAPARRKTLLFTAAYMEVDNTYLVAKSSDFLTVQDVDCPGVKVAVNRGNAADLFLTRQFTHASIVRCDTEASALSLLKAGEVQAQASSKQLLLEFSKADPRYRVMAGRYSAIPHGLAIPAGRPAAAEYLRMFIEDIKSNGAVRRAIDSAGVKGVSVAPPA